MPQNNKNTECKDHIKVGGHSRTTSSSEVIGIPPSWLFGRKSVEVDEYYI